MTSQSEFATEVVCVFHVITDLRGVPKSEIHYHKVTNQSVLYKSIGNCVFFHELCGSIITFFFYVFIE